MAQLTFSEQVKQAYSPENLNLLTHKIVSFYKAKQFQNLREMEKLVNEFFPFYEEKISRVFSRLVMLYHPDKQAHFHAEIEAKSSQQNEESLNQYAHILPMLDLIDTMEITGYAASSWSTPEEFEEEYGWNYQPRGEDYFMMHEEYEDEDRLFDEENPDDYGYTSFRDEGDNSFLSAVKRKIYGPRAIDFPVYLLEDLEEIEMAEYEIDDLSGIEYCRYLLNLDLSVNHISDIRELAELHRLQELYLADNEISAIDALHALYDLRILDLSNNRIDDISPLFHLPALEFVNLAGNPVSLDQINRLKNRGVAVI